MRLDEVLTGSRSVIRLFWFLLTEMAIWFVGSSRWLAGNADNTKFKDHLIRAGAEGGITAANILSDYVKDYLQSYLGGHADQCRVMVRIYANVLGLSKSLARVGLCGNEARSLSHFTASFTRAEDLFDYVDAGDKKEGADHKIRGMFGRHQTR